jgi:hypothetical protein
MIPDHQSLSDTRPDRKTSVKERSVLDELDCPSSNDFFDGSSPSSHFLLIESGWGSYGVRRTFIEKRTRDIHSDSTIPVG